MNKFKIYWWIRGVGGKQRKQGQDVIETEIDFFDVWNAEEFIEEDLEAQVPQRVSGSVGHFGTFSAKADEENWKPSIPNFVKAHKKIMEQNRCGVSNWGVTKITSLGE